MKKYGWIVLLVVVLVVAGIVYFYNSNSKQNSNYSAQRSRFNNISNTNNSTNSINNSTTNNTSNSVLNSTAKIPVETEIASFSTKIQNKKDSNRQGNITITCNTLNNTIVKPGETFSFCNTVGKSTEERGYKEANVIIQGTETKGLGGRKLSSKFNFI